MGQCPIQFNLIYFLELIMRTDVTNPNMSHFEIAEAFKDEIYPEPDTVIGRTIDAPRVRLSNHLAKLALTKLNHCARPGVHLMHYRGAPYAVTPVFYPKRFGMTGIGYWVGIELTSSSYPIRQFTPEFIMVPASVGIVNAAEQSIKDAALRLYQAAISEYWQFTDDNFISSIKACLKIYALMCDSAYKHVSSKLYTAEAYRQADSRTPWSAAGTAMFYDSRYYISPFNGRWLPIPMDDDQWLQEPRTVDYIELFVYAIENMEAMRAKHPTIDAFLDAIRNHDTDIHDPASMWRIAAASVVL